MQGWQATGNMETPREGHTATVLRDGTVLVYGGFSAQGPLFTAERYSPATGTWASTGSTFYGRAGHTAHLLPDGRVLVVGGTENVDTRSTELYDPGTGEWYPTGQLNAKRPFNHAATSLADGRVLVVGGYDPTVPFPDCFLNSAEIYDPSTHVWTQAGNLIFGRYSPTATPLADGRVLVVGGGNGSTGFQNTAELFDPAAGTWTLTGGLFYFRFGHTATRLQNGKVIVAGGLTYSPVPRPHDESLDAVEIYDPATGNWSSVGRMTMPRRYHTATLLPDGKVLVVGGIQHDLYTGGFLKLKSAELYDPATFVWTSAGEMATPRSGHTETLLGVIRRVPVPTAFHVTHVLVAGGDPVPEYSQPLESCEMFTSDDTPVVATT
jgi:N-acetylneuraminic acid mutarotase